MPLKSEDLVLTERIDTAIVSYVLEKGRQPSWLRMSYATFHAQWGNHVRRDDTSMMWVWRGIPISIRASMPLGEVEVI